MVFVGLLLIAISVKFGLQCAVYAKSPFVPVAIVTVLEGVAPLLPLHPANESVLSSVCISFVEELIKSIHKNEFYKCYDIKEILDYYTIYFIPMVNPDGVGLVLREKEILFNSSYQHIWEKYYSVLELWKNNIRGVDIENNYRKNWNKKALKLLKQGNLKPNSNSYPGLNYLSERENSLLDKQTEIQEIKNKMEDVLKQQLEELENISHFSKEKAKEEIMKIVEAKMAKEIASYVKEREIEAKLDLDDKAKEMLVTCMQKYSADVTNEQTVSVITLPNDEMKGRIIGREGRNVRTIESVTGVDLIIDDTPEAIVISSFDPLRREIARLTIEGLIKDGRIHPSRIEELYDKMCNEMNQKIKEYGRNAMYELGLSKIDPELIEIIGKLNFRSSYGQNALTHSMEVAKIAGLLAGELGENVALAKRAGLLEV